VHIELFVFKIWSYMIDFKNHPFSLCPNWGKCMDVCNFSLYVRKKCTWGNLFSNFHNNWTSTMRIIRFWIKVMIFVVFVLRCWRQTLFILHSQQLHETLTNSQKILFAEISRKSFLFMLNLSKCIWYWVTGLGSVGMEWHIIIKTKWTKAPLKLVQIEVWWGVSVNN